MARSHIAAIGSMLADNTRAEILSVLMDGHDHVELTDSGCQRFQALGVDVDAARAAKRPTVRPCLDWTERRHHLAGAAATGLLDAFLAKRWVARGRSYRHLQPLRSWRRARLSLTR